LIINPYPPLEFISAEEVGLIHQTALRIVSELGLEFMHEGAMRLMQSHGAKVNFDTGIVRMDAEKLMQWVNEAPSKFQVFARNTENNITLGGNFINFAPVAGPPNVSCLDKGRRPGSYEDQKNLIKLGQSLNILSTTGGSPVEAIDLPAESRHLDLYLSKILLTDRIWGATAIGSERVEDALAMVAISRGVSREELKNQPSLTTVINVNSPRKMDTEMTAGLMAMAENGQPCIVTPFTLSGAMSPITIPGAIAQQAAEALLVIALTQMVRPGCPVIFGGFTSNVDMKSGSPAFGTPEYVHGIVIGAQMARFYGIPYRSSNVNASNAVDAQATYESMMSLWAAIMSHTHMINHATGWLEGGLTASYEKYILDAEMLQGLTQVLNRPEISEETLAFDDIRAVEPGGHYFDTEHTQSRFASAFYAPMLSDWRNFESWQEDGAQDASRRANGIWKALLNNFVAPPIDNEVRQKLETYVEKRKAEMSAS
jgi:trimethylamine--corrinoid protein Co-methyltransferase